MSRILRSKLEAALVGYCVANAATLGVAADRIVSGRSTGEPELNYWCIYVPKGTADADSPEVCTFEVQFHFKSAATPGGNDLAIVDAALDKMHTLLMQPPDDTKTWSQQNPPGGALLAALNKPPSGTDARAVKPLHIYDITPVESPGDSHNEGWDDQLVYRLLAQPMDSH